MGISIWQLLILVMILLPLALTLFSGRAKGSGKVGWVILVFFISWPGYAIFLIVTQFLRKQELSA